MHLVEKNVPKERNGQFMGPNFESSVANAADHFELWGSSFNDPGPDFCEWRAISPSGEVIARYSVAGY